MTRLILRLINSHNKTVAFITDKLILLDTAESIQSAKANQISNIQLIKRGQQYFLRSIRNSSPEDNLLNHTVSIKQYFDWINDLKINASKSNIMKAFQVIKGQFLEHQYPKSEIVYIDGIAKKSKSEVEILIRKYATEIQQSAIKLDIDPLMVGAILIDEYCRVGIDDLLDFLAPYLSERISVGLAQINLVTAREIIRAGHTTLKPDIDPIKLNNYLIQPKHSIFFCTARIRQIIDYWKPVLDLSARPDIIGTLYSQGLGIPHRNPIANYRGQQIKKEFYPWAKSLLDL